MEWCTCSVADITTLCPASTILCSNTLNLSLVDMFQSIPCPERSLGLRFLFPVYLIDRVEMTPHTFTSPATIDQGLKTPHLCFSTSIHAKRIYICDMQDLNPLHNNYGKYIIFPHAVKALLHCLGKTVFLREEGETPMKLTEQQALQLQKMTLVTQPQI